MVVLAGRDLQKRLEEDPFHVQRTFFSGREVEGKISVIICYRDSSGYAQRSASGKNDHRDGEGCNEWEMRGGGQKNSGK